MISRVPSGFVTRPVVMLIGGTSNAGFGYTSSDIELNVAESILDGTSRLTVIGVVNTAEVVTEKVVQTVHIVLPYPGGVPKNGSSRVFPVAVTCGNVTFA